MFYKYSKCNYQKSERRFAYHSLLDKKHSRTILLILRCKEGILCCHKGPAATARITIFPPGVWESWRKINGSLKKHKWALFFEKWIEGLSVPPCRYLWSDDKMRLLKANTNNNHHDNRRVQCVRNTMSSDDVRSVRPFMNEGTDACAKGYRRTMVRYQRLSKGTNK